MTSKEALDALGEVLNFTEASPENDHYQDVIDKILEKEMKLKGETD